MNKQLTSLKEMPVTGLAENAKRTVEYNVMSKLLNEIATRFQTLGRKF